MTTSVQKVLWLSNLYEEHDLLTALMMSENMYTFRNDRVAVGSEKLLENRKSKLSF